MSRTKLEKASALFAAATIQLILALPVFATGPWDCSASAVFAGCEIVCAVGQEASCESEPSLFLATCTCDGFKGGSMPVINVAHELELLSYIGLLQSLGSDEALAVADAAQGIIDAALAGDMVRFDMAVEQHGRAFEALSEDDRNEVYGLLGLGGLIEDIGEIFEGIWDWIKDRFSDLWELLKDLPKWVLEEIKAGRITVGGGVDVDGDGEPDYVDLGWSP